MTSTTSSNFSQAKIDAYIRKKTLELGERTLKWGLYVNKERIEAGNGTSWKAVRYLNLDVVTSVAGSGGAGALVGLTEGVAPAETDLEVETITATATQYGIVVKITDVLELTIASRPLQNALKKKADLMSSLIEILLSNKALTGTNVIFGGTATTRDGLSATGGDVLTSSIARKAVAALRSTDGIKGQAPYSAADETYIVYTHTKVEFDLQKDATYENVAKEDQKSRDGLILGRAKRWAGGSWFYSDFIPQFKNISNGSGGAAALTSGVAVTSTRGLNGFTVTAVDGGGSLTSGATHYFKVTRKAKKRGHEEDVSIEHTLAAAATGNNESFTVVLPSDTAYVYNLYVGTVAGSLFRHSSGLNRAAGASITVAAATEFPSTNAAAPVAPPRHTTSTTTEVADVFPVFLVGGDSLARVDLQDMESFMTRGPDSGNPLNQFVLCGSKFMMGEALLQNAFLQRAEVQSAFTAS